MTDKKDKPAFPHQKEDGSPYWGMTLRDYFAAHIFADVRQQVSNLSKLEYDGMMIHFKRKPQNSKMLVAMMTYEYADALLHARDFFDER